MKILMKSLKLGELDMEINILSSLVPEVDEIKLQFEEDLKNYSDDGEVNSFEDIYASVLYCNNEYVWGASTY